MNNKIEIIANKIKELNDKYKNLLNNVSDKKEIEKEEDIIRMEVIKLEEFANKNNIPFVFNAEDIFINIQSLKTGVPEYYEYEESSDYEESSEYEDEDEDDI